jgi:hypothetical protein
MDYKKIYSQSQSDVNDFLDSLIDIGFKEGLGSLEYRTARGVINVYHSKYTGFKVSYTRENSASEWDDSDASIWDEPSIESCKERLRTFRQLKDLI